MMPYPNEHSCRLNPPDKYDKFSRKNCYVKHENKCIDFIFGIKDGSSEVQAMRYGKDAWTASDAREHCQSKGGEFEAAAGGTENVKQTIVRRWFSMQATEDEAEIAIFDEIGGWGVSVADFKKEYDSIKARKAIKVLINSPGGNVFDGMALYNILAQQRQKTTVDVLGLAASAAGVVSLAGSKLRMGTGAYLMIHNPWGLAIGDSEEMLKMAALLDSVKAQILDIYASRSSKSREDLAKMMDEETWFTADQAIEYGFAQEMFDQEPVAALGFSMDKYGYRHAPQGVIAIAKQAPRPPQTERDFEQFLRDGGFSHRIAAGITAKGFEAARREDAGSPGSGRISGDALDAAIEETLSRF